MTRPKRRKLGRPSKAELKAREDRPEFADLSLQERRFAEEFTLDLNKSRAARRVGFSTKSAHTYGFKLYRDRRVRAYIDWMLNERAARLKSSGDKIILELQRIAFFDIRSLYHQDGSHKTLLELDDDQVSAISDVTFYSPKKLKPVNDGNKYKRKNHQPEEVVKLLISKISRYNKMEALKMLGAYHGLRLENRDPRWTPPPDQPDKDQIKSFEELVRNLDAKSLEKLGEIFDRAAAANDTQEPETDFGEGSGGKESRTLH